MVSKEKICDLLLGENSILSQNTNKKSIFAGMMTLSHLLPHLLLLKRKLNFESKLMKHLYSSCN